jgi:hypothetical protein
MIVNPLVLAANARVAPANTVPTSLLKSGACVASKPQNTFPAESTDTLRSHVKSSVPLNSLDVLDTRVINALTVAL